VFVVVCCGDIVEPRFDRLYGRPSDRVRIVSETGFARSTVIMQNNPTTQLLRRIKEETVERHVTFDESRFSLSERMHEVTMLAEDASPRPAVNACTDLELGAHVALMRTLTHVDRSPDVRSWIPLSAPRALPASWATA
jgi:hypothetical protein